MRIIAKGLTIAACALVLLATPPATVSAGLPVAQDRGGMPTLAPILKKITPGVVNIAVKGHVEIQQNPLFQDPFFRRFFDLPEQPRRRETQSVGSGVIVDAAKGHVLTNHHVIKDADEITVTLKDGRRLKATLVGSDPGTDIALLKVKAGGLTEVPFGDSDRLEVGDFVIAIGNPFGLGQTVTSGIVSALGRSGLKVEGYEDFIQTDASINPGNSGGALVDLNGRLIGINTAIIGPSGGNVGIGFAVPVTMARAVMGQLLRHGEVRRGRLGVTIQDLSPSLAKALKAGVAGGAVVTSVEAGTGAEKAGLKPGDVIVAVDDRALRNASDLRNRIGLAPVGTKVTLSIVRDGKKKRVIVRIGKLKGKASVAGKTIGRIDGAVFQDRRNVGGAVVATVRQGSPASGYGLREGDVVVAVNQKRVVSVREFMRAAGRVRGALILHVRRDSRQLLVVIN